MSALDLLQEIDRRQERGGHRHFRPLAASLRLHGETNLFKIRAGRNIAGLELELVAQPESLRESGSGLSKGLW